MCLPDCGRFINFCLALVDILRRYRVKVIAVFDGRRLPIKAETEEERQRYPLLCLHSPIPDSLPCSTLVPGGLPMVVLVVAA